MTERAKLCLLAPAVVDANQLLAEIYRTGKITLPSGKTRAAHRHGMSQEEGSHLAALVRRERPRTSLEVGLGFGLSTMFICQALADCGSGRHIAMDPLQSTVFKRAGLHHLELAGLRGLVEFHEESSHRVLPRLEALGLQVDFAFVDGFHVFDYTLLEFFFIDRMLRVGGLIAFDDMWMPSVRKVVRYGVTNRGYRDESRFLPARGDRLRRLAGGLRALPRAVAWAIADERQEILTQELGRIPEHGLAVLRKTKDDDRVWTHHVDF